MKGIKIMDEKYCDDCFCRMRAHGFRYDIKDENGNPTYTSWVHCDHKDREMPIDLVKICPEG